jgi:hypothetical protein
LRFHRIIRRVISATLAGRRAAGAPAKEGEMLDARLKVVALARGLPERFDQRVVDLDHLATIPTNEVMVATMFE